MAPKWRGQGTGRALMEAAEAWARARGCREISTPSWLAPRRGPQRGHEQAASALADGATFACGCLASDAELSSLLGQEVHRRLGYQEVERIVCFRKDL
ncbi:GNAT family N-acetyltransferase [Thermus tengchongensis]|uniref:GNAT family N-acetyltransferase n=1 Tax=Thermus tengchongensis TaxID=1214928 RepID=UPI001F0EB3B4|nr:GNAT family N-acetyltransferase [Thermus tengchongensis]